MNSHYSTQLFDANYVDTNYWMPIIQGGVGLVPGPPQRAILNLLFHEGEMNVNALQRSSCDPGDNHSSIIFIIISFPARPFFLSSINNGRRAALVVPSSSWCCRRLVEKLHLDSHAQPDISIDPPRF